MEGEEQRRLFGRLLGNGHLGVLGGQRHQDAHDQFVEGKPAHRSTMTGDQLSSREYNPDEPVHREYVQRDIEEDGNDAAGGGVKTTDEVGQLEGRGRLDGSIRALILPSRSVTALLTSCPSIKICLLCLLTFSSTPSQDPDNIDASGIELDKLGFNPEADLLLLPEGVKYEYTEDPTQANTDSDFTGPLIARLGGITAICQYCKAGTCHRKNHNRLTGRGQLENPDMAGRGRPGQNGGLKGATWDHDETLKLEVKPSELYPPHPNLKKPAPPTEKQNKQVKYYKELQEDIHRGPLYTKPTKRDPNAPAQTFSEDQYNRQFGTNTKADVDPFTGVETYSMKYAPKKNVLPKLSDGCFDKSLFPEELWSTLEGEEGEEVRNHINRAMEKKARMMSDLSKFKNPSDKAASLLEKIDKAAGDVDDDEKEDDGEEEREVDDTFSDASGDDYNAEAYFDDGEGGDEADDAGGDDY